MASSSTESDKDNEKHEKPPLYDLDVYYAENIDGNFRLHYNVRPNEIIQERYKLTALIRHGSFARVVKGYDIEYNGYVAIKIAKKSATCNYLALNGLEMGHTVYHLVPDEEEMSLFAIYYNHIMWKGHLFVSMELLYMTLEEVMNYKMPEGFSIETVSFIGRQLLTALMILSRPKLNIIHGNLNTSNIMVSDIVYNKNLRVKICDFEFAQKADERKFSIVGKPQYRAPEVSLKIGFDHSIDAWSMACVLAELFTTKVLFKENTYLQPLTNIIPYFGLPPTEMIDRSPVRDRYFEKNDDDTYKLAMYQTVMPELKLRDFLFDIQDVSRNIIPVRIIKLLDLLRNILVYDPSSRMTLEEAIEHRFIGLSLPALDK